MGWDPSRLALALALALGPWPWAWPRKKKSLGMFLLVQAQWTLYETENSQGMA